MLPILTTLLLAQRPFNDLRLRTKQVPKLFHQISRPDRSQDYPV
jgi:hypothetical protein